ncbi:MAG TPA: hypothetical protein VLS49_10485 [Usitatibacter sp.]|nr:hypothetical protein [Usitatibacter sp.]
MAYAFAALALLWLAVAAALRFLGRPRPVVCGLSVLAAAMCAIAAFAVARVPL